jgi:hypothetical protein
MMMMEPSPLPLPFGERGLRLGNLRKARALPFLDAEKSGGGELGEMGKISMDVIEGLLRPELEYTESLGGNGGGLESELNLKPLKRESSVDIVVVSVQPSFDPTCLN